MSKFNALLPFIENDLALFRQDFFPGMRPERYRGANPILGRIDETRYRVPDLGRFQDATFSGLIGGQGPSDYSSSPALWNPFFQRLGLVSVYFCFDVSPARSIQAFITTAQRIPGCLNLNFTDPYKQAAFAYLQQAEVPVEMSVQAEALQAVNHLIRDPRSGTLQGLNTDGLGLIDGLEDPKSLAGRQVLLIGAGASAASIGLELARLGCSIHIANRTESKAIQLADFLTNYAGPDTVIQAGGLDTLDSKLDQSEWVISTVTQGSSLIEGQVERLPEHAIVVDIRYGEKALLTALAKSAGRTSFDGRMMLFGQFAQAARRVGQLLGASASDVHDVLAGLRP